MAIGRQAQTHSHMVIKSESEDEQPRAGWGSWSTTVRRNLSTSSLVSHSWKGGTGGRGVCPVPILSHLCCQVPRKRLPQLEILGLLGCRSFGICSW